MLGIQLGRHEIRVAQLDGAGGRARAYSQKLSIDILSGDRQLAAEEISNFLKANDIKTRRCAVCFPTEWVMTRQVKVPEGLEPEDLESLLDLEAERLFPYAPADLRVESHLFTDSAGEQCATLMALPHVHLEAMDGVLRKARLNPVSIAPVGTVLAAEAGGEADLDPPHRSIAHGLLICESDSIDFAVTVGGIVALLRSFPRFDAQGETGSATADLAREILLSLQGFPAAERSDLMSIRVLGKANAAASLADELGERLAAHKITFILDEPAKDLAPEYLAVRRAAAWALADEKPVFDYFVPRPRVIRERYNQLMKWGALTQASLVLGVAALLLVIAFTFRHIRLNYLEREWEKIAEPTAELQSAQDDIRRWRDWFSDDSASLNLMLALTQAFPETGEVWARSVRIQDRTNVTCTGSARSDQDYLKVFDALQQTRGVENLKLSQVRGENPIQFTFTFQWIERGGA